MIGAPASPFQVGDWTVTPLLDGTFRLDGGSMWGVVPKVLWRNMTPPADDNTILLALRPFLAEKGDDVVLIEVGIGARWNARQRAIYHIDGTGSLDETLAACGRSAADVTHVVATHCHWDHIGSQVIEDGGELRPHFPNAVHYAPAIEVSLALRPGHARSGSYRAEDVSVIQDHALLQTYSGEAELLPGLWVHEVGGHSDGVSLVTIGDEHGERAIFWSDVVPTTKHVQPPYIMAYDVDVIRSFDVRSEWISRAADEGWIGLFYHDPDVGVGRIVRDGRRFAVHAL